MLRGNSSKRQRGEGEKNTEYKEDTSSLENVPGTPGKGAEE